ncbi:hypothetical protein KH5H1_22340 [Corallococcus caeni]|uniref:Signal peptidase I n=1 Tax=Corallococcus caeni TaxID=3082388 RepID=A0ABQ6QSW4_9BACT|nr:hypothetical protein KH5H1_22340 [Corallococcus sp. KH5-1]GMU07080.1 hypothetical protein ASNO1_33330 [Corallococcus sp. NO1]
MDQQQLEMMQQMQDQQASGPGPLFWIFYLAFIGLVVAGMWKTFTKAGEPGWAAIVPFYNLYVMTKIVGRPAWWVVLAILPCVNIIALIILSIDMAKSFGKGVGFGIGLALLGPVFYAILGFGDAQYQGPSASGGGMAAA